MVPLASLAARAGVPFGACVRRMNAIGLVATYGGVLHGARVGDGEQAADRMKAVRAAVGPDIGVGKHGSPPPPYPRAGLDERTECGARRS